MTGAAAGRGVLRFDGLERAALRGLLSRYGLALTVVAPEAVIPGSFWGEREAGLIGGALYVRCDTPVHSVLHEAAHFICMTPARRARLDTDAGGDDAEESAVCYLQILLAAALQIGSEQLCRDMDEWGYTFRLGSASSWFSEDAEDARLWLVQHALIDGGNRLTHACR
jgi:hypothetical protein